MTDQLISFETAKLAKEKGFTIFTGFMNYYNSNGKFEERLHENFDEDSDGDFCPGFNINNPELYDNPYYPTALYYPAPSQSLLQKWLREVHKIIVSPFISWNLITWGYNIHFINVKDVTEEAKKRVYHGANYHSYEETLEQGLIEALKLI